MSELAKDAAAARALGLSYGEYKAMQYLRGESPQEATRGPQKPQKSLKRYDDREAFKLWQEGKTDAQIASALGVSRTIIQRWRDVLELPSTHKKMINTKKYRLEKNRDGSLIAVKDDGGIRQNPRKR